LFRRSADRRGAGRVRLGKHVRQQQPHPSTSSPSSRPRDAMPPPVAPPLSVGSVTSTWTGRASAFTRPYASRHPSEVARRLFRKIKSRAAIWVWLRPGVPVSISRFFSVFLSREGRVGPDNSECVLGSWNSKKLRGSRAASDATLNRTVRPDGQVRRRHLLASRRPAPAAHLFRVHRSGTCT
jgi:hypothetical protein